MKHVRPVRPDPAPQADLSPTTTPGRTPAPPEASRGPELTPAPPAPAGRLDTDLRHIVSELCDLLGAARSTLFLLDQRTGELQSRYVYVAVDRQVFVLPPRALQPSADALWEQVSHTLEPLIIEDAQHDSRIPNRERMRELGVVSIMEVPLVAEGRAIGMVAVARQASSPDFDQATLRVARSFANQAALALENARLLERAAKQAEQLALVNEVGRRIHAILDPERLLDELAALITTSFHYYYTAICLTEGANLVVRAAHSAGQGRDARLIGLVLPVDGPSLAGWAMRNNHPLLVNDVGIHPDYFATEGLQEAGSALAVPLLGREGVRGALVVEAQQQEAFDHGDVTLMEALAGQITVALANAGLYRQAADRASALAAANARLAELDQLKTDFLSMVSHELRSPLGLIKGYVGTLLASEPGRDPTTQREFLTVIDQETDALAELVGNLLDMSQIEAGTLRVEPQATDLGALLAAAAATLHKRFPARRVRVDTPAVLPPAWVDGRRIAQVLGNLLENAARYSWEDGLIVVEVAPAPGTLRITVRDPGPGIPPTDLPFIFDKFYRAPGGVRQEGGTGLGLTIARGIVEAHGGCLHAENLPEAGAAFHFTVPMARPQ